MNRPQLQALLRTLRAEIDATHLADPQAHQRLATMLAEIETQLMSGAPVAAPAAEGMVDGLRQAVEQFEVEHPRTAGLLNQLVNALSAMGI